MKMSGVSLVELLTVLTLLGVSLLIALPDLKVFQNKQQINSELRHLIRAIMVSRDQAITFNHSVIICPSRIQSTCGGDWHEGFVVFVDTNSNAQLDVNESILLTKESFRDGDKIFWRAFRRRNYLEFTPLGFTAFQNGTFTYCPKEGIEYAEGLILNAQGRLRFTVDKDGDAIDEGANGKPLRCD